jgi:acetyltransferase
VILFGAGGVLAEVLQDSALALPPLNRTLARRLIERTRVARALEGAPGRKAIDMAALETLLVRFSGLVTEFAADIAEIDINPLLAGPGRVVALDARVVLTPPDLPESQRPRLAVPPYPKQYVAPHRLADGTEILVRPNRPEDEPLIVELHEGHSERTIRMRFFGLVRRLTRDSLIRLCHIDYNRDMALAALRRGADGRPHMIGVARYHVPPQTGEAEFALVVTDAWQGKGVGSHLMRRLADVARQRGIRRLVGDVLRENAPMLRLMGRLGFTTAPTEDAAVVRVAKELSDSPV